MGSSERRREIRRRRHRKKKTDLFKRKADKANTSEKLHLAGKLRALTPGAEAIINALSLEER